MRINLFGGPNTGKSLLAAYVYDHLRREGFSLELVQEAIKPAAYRGERPPAWFNKDFFDEQLRRERDWIHSGVPHLITDSPIMLQCFYMSLGHYPEMDGCVEHACAWETQNPSVNIFLRRNLHYIPYQQAGRYQDQQAAERVDQQMKDYLDRKGVRLIEFDAADRFTLLRFIRDEIVRQPLRED